MHRAVEAELWGVHSELTTGVDGLTIGQAVGMYGTLYEVVCYLPWTISRLVDYVGQLLPAGAIERHFDHQDDDDEDCEGALIAHFWLEAESRIVAGATAPPSISKPSI